MKIIELGGGERLKSTRTPVSGRMWINVLVPLPT